MSDNFRGITFSEQTVTPADDAIVRRAILPDGILSGCEITYSGSTLTMAAGHIIACGRVFQNLTAQNWAVVDATYGFARLILTIDLTKTSTELAFKQIASSIEYSATENGFINLEQEDINVAGNRYQMVACVVSLGPGGITKIVSQMEKSRASGDSLNFKVVGGLTRPDDPAENTIWVKTNTKITEWAFGGYDEIEYVPLEEGAVWFYTGTSSIVPFNALKKHQISIYPIDCWQNIYGEWTKVPAATYQNGRWVDWWRGELYDAGNEYTSVTGGWIAQAVPIHDGWDGKEPPFTKNAASMTISCITDDEAGGIVRTANSIDLTDFSTLNFNGAVSTGTNGHDFWFDFVVWSSIGTCYTQNVAAFRCLEDSDGESGTFTINVAGLTGKYYIGFAVHGDGDQRVDVSKVWLQ